MKSDRLLSALLLLQARGRLTSRELAKRFEVSQRTVHRDMEALGAAGVPIYALRGSRGGWQLDEGWRTQVPGLNEAELQGLLMAQPRAIGNGPFAGAAERALGKLLASLPPSMREQAAAIRQRLYIDPTGWRGSPENMAMLPVVQDAVSRDRRLAMSYWRAGRDRVEREVDPLGLVAKGSHWYLVAHTADGFRTYRVSRIEQATVLQAPCRRPADFDLEAYWKSSTDRLSEGWPRFEATLRVEPRAAVWLKMWRTPKPLEVGDGPDAQGWITMRIQFDNLEEATFVTLGLGTHAIVVEPAALQERLVHDVQALTARLRTDGVLE
jgi:predicted DNA-binding transcriptional regulator YafY